jgi:hypothetical protein
MARIERATSPLPRECSTTELHGPNSLTAFASVRRVGAGEGNRTLVVSLEGFCSTIELHPRRLEENPCRVNRKSWWRGKDSNLRRLSQQIYSLPPLTAREPLRTKPGIIGAFARSVKQVMNENRGKGAQTATSQPAPKFAKWMFTRREPDQAPPDPLTLVPPHTKSVWPEI